MQTDLSMIQTAYSNSAHLEVHATEVTDVLARELSFALRHVLSALGSEYEEAFWFDLLAPLKRYRSHLAISVLPLNHHALFPGDSVQLLQNQRANIIRRKPQLETVFEAIIEALEMLAEDDGTPLLDRVLELRSHQVAGHDAIVIGHEHHRDATTDLLIHRAQSDLKVVTARQLRQLEHFDRLFVTGPATWHAAHVIGAPRAPRIDVVRFEWLQDPIKIESGFAYPLRALTRSLSVTPVPRTVAITDEQPKLSRTETVNEVNWKILAALHAPSQHGSDELVTAHLVQLEGNQGVFLERDGQVFVLDPLATELERVQRIGLTELKHGDYLILRIAGGGDQVSELASRHLGIREAHIRECQRTWKGKFKDFEFRNDMDRTIRLLKQAGATKAATAGNIRNWLEPHTIKPRNIADLRAILIVCGLAAQQNQYLEAAHKLASAHISAGQDIRKQLMNRLRSMDLKTLERVGWLELELNVGGGAIAVQRVTGISHDTARVAGTHLGQRMTLRT